MTKPALQYAIYPGTVTLYSGEEQTFTAEELAEAYGVEDEDYLVVNNNSQVPSDMAYFNYIHLKPRADGVYRDIKDTAQDDDQTITMGEDFDGTKTYTQETDRKNIDKDLDLPHN